MKRHTILPLTALLLAMSLLCGCGGIYTNYKDLEQLQIIQTLGADRDETGGITLSAASGADVSGGAPAVLSIGASSVETAMEKLQEYSARETLYFAHTQFLLAGEDAARAGMDEYLDYIQRIPLLRSDVRLFLVHGSRAETLITGSGDGKYDVSDELQSLLRDLEHQNGMQVFSCTEVSRRLAESGAALVCALDAADTEGVIFSGGGGLAALSAGYGVLKDGRLAGYILGDDARGVDLLGGTLSGGPVALKAPDGSTVTVQLRSGSTRLTPVWGEDGSLVTLRAEAALSAELAELEHPSLAAQPDFSRALSGALRVRAEGWLREVLELSAALDADFLALGETLRRQDARRFDAMPRSWEETLPALRFSVSVDAELIGSFENEGAVNTQGSGIGGTA